MTKGTKEWANSNINFQTGCKAGCEYCYSREMANRFNRKKWDDWTNIEFREKDIDKQYRKRNGTIMFPSSHNIDESNYTLASCILAKLLTSRNKVLIVMKPELKVIKKLCKDFILFRSQIELRFTITTHEDSKREIFEPFASSISERYHCIEIAHHNFDYHVSISIEPFLDFDPVVLINELLWEGIKPKDIWLGPMNHLKKLSNLSNLINEHLDRLQLNYKPYRLRGIKSRLEERNLNINYKDGFLNQMVGNQSKEAQQ